MSEQEKTTGETGASGQSVVMVESGARHKQSYRPTELQDDAPDLHHKRSRAPAVPSTEELKASTETSGTKERKESERGISSEKHKSNAAKKLSSNTKGRGSSPEAITLAPLEVETKRATLTAPPQPIPAQVESMASMGSDATGKFGEDKKDDDDSIKEEIAELRTSVVAKPSSEWADNETDGENSTAQNDDEENIPSQEEKDVIDYENIPQQKVNIVENLPQKRNDHYPKDQNVPQEGKHDSPEEDNRMNVKNTTEDIHIKKKEISWNEKEYLQTVNLQKSRKGIDEDLKTMPSVINITVSKKNIVNDFIARRNNKHGKDKLDLKIGDAPNATFFSALRGRINDMREKIRNTFNT